MIVKAGLAGLAALFLTAAVAGAQATRTTTPPGDHSAPMDSATPAGTPYSDGGSALPRDPIDMPPMHNSSNAAAHGSDSAAVVRGSSEDKAIARCQALSADLAARDAVCAALARKHPTMLNGPQ
jgi:hypothetical protein